MFFMVLSHERVAIWRRSWAVLSPLFSACLYESVHILGLLEGCTRGRELRVVRVALWWVLGWGFSEIALKFLRNCSETALVWGIQAKLLVCIFGDVA
jgi:hypothetical protein